LAVSGCSMMKSKIEPKYDMLTGEPIKFKSREQYEGSFYSNRKNLIKHFKQITKEEIIKITKKILENKIDSKKINYAPSTIECKSLNIPCPSPAFIQSFGLDYNEICESCGLVVKYKYEDLPKKKCNLPQCIVVDTREQEILPIKNQFQILKLDFGDYAISTDLNNTVSVEKKNGNDFVGTVSKGFERFCRELERANQVNSNILIVVSEKLSNMLSFNYLPQFKWIRAQPSFVFSRLRSILQTYPNTQAVFVQDKQEAARMTEFALGYGKDLFRYDVQYLYDLNKNFYDSV
jgi:hypothetical protein